MASSALRGGGCAVLALAQEAIESGGSTLVKRGETVAAEAPYGPVRRLWNAMGPFAYVGAALILMSLALTPPTVAGG